MKIVVMVLGILMVVIGVGAPSLGRFGEPQLTETQLLLKYWWAYLVLGGGLRMIWMHGRFMGPHNASNKRSVK